MPPTIDVASALRALRRWAIYLFVFGVCAQIGVGCRGCALRWYEASELRPTVLR